MNNRNKNLVENLKTNEVRKNMILPNQPMQPNIFKEKKMENNMIPSRFQSLENMKNFKIPMTPENYKKKNNNRYINNVNAFNRNESEKPMSDLLQFFFQLMITLKTYHWQTKSYSRHKASDKGLESLMEHIDKFVEVFQGRYKRLSILENVNDIIYIRNRNDSEIEDYLKECILFLENDLEEVGYVKSSDTDLLNIRDEMVSDIHQTLYLFSLQ